MKKQLGMTTAMAAALLALPGCSSSKEPGWEDVVADNDTAVCVDKAGKRVEDAQCMRQSAATSGGHGGGGNAFLWYYLGRNSRVPFYGDAVSDPRYAGGSYNQRVGGNYMLAPSDANMTRSAAISRGGMGSRGRYFGGGRS